MVTFAAKNDDFGQFEILKISFKCKNCVMNEVYISYTYYISFQLSEIFYRI